MYIQNQSKYFNKFNYYIVPLECRIFLEKLKSKTKTLLILTCVYPLIKILQKLNQINSKMLYEKMLINHKIIKLTIL